MSQERVNNIPQELRNRAQWINWTAEFDADGKPTKIPRQPRTGKKADVTNPDHWTSFEQAFEIAVRENVGIGYCLTKNDPYVVIDLDEPKKFMDPDDYKKLKQNHYNILDDGQSYVELSPSGKGYHLWLRTEQQFGGCRSSDDCIEMYADGRFMTVTGDKVSQTGEINAHEELVAVLRKALEKRERPIDVVEKPATETPEQVIARIMSYSNAEKFMKAAETSIHDKNVDQSGVDQQVMNWIVHACRNIKLAIETFDYTPRGKREKWRKREDYRLWTVKKGFDFSDMQNGGITPDLMQTIAAIKENWIVDQQVQQQVQQIQETEQDDAPKAQVIQRNVTFTDGLVNGPGCFTNPGGLLGRIMDYFYRSAYRPIPEVALAGALGVMSAVCGRAYNANGMGLNLYVILLAKTGVGKNAAIQAPTALLETVAFKNGSIRKFVGGRAASAQALMKSFGKRNDINSYCSFYDEFGELFKRMSNERDNPHMAALLGPIMELYTNSGRKGHLPETLHSKSDDTTAKVQSPSYSFVGASVPETFYESLSPEMATKGLLPRLNIINYEGGTVEPNHDAFRVYPPDALLDDLFSLCSTSLNVNGLFPHRPIEVEFAPAEQHFREFASFCDRKVNLFAKDSALAALWSRTAEKARKIAGIVAVGHNWYTPVVSMDMAKWAIDFALHDVAHIQEKMEAGETGTKDNEADRIERVKRVFIQFLKESAAKFEGTRKRWIELQGRQLVPKTYLLQKLSTNAAFKTPTRAYATATQAIELTLRTLISFDQLELVNGEKYSDNTPINSAVYRIKDVTWLAE